MRTLSGADPLGLLALAACASFGAVRSRNVSVSNILPKKKKRGFLAET